VFSEASLKGPTSISEDRRLQLDCDVGHRHIGDDPKDKEERRELRRQKRDHGFHRQSTKMFGQEKGLADSADVTKNSQREHGCITKSPVYNESNSTEPGRTMSRGGWKRSGSQKRQY
jgi:hypothetical protein